MRPGTGRHRRHDRGRERHDHRPLRDGWRRRRRGDHGACDRRLVQGFGHPRQPRIGLPAAQAIEHERNAVQRSFQCFEEFGGRTGRNVTGRQFGFHEMRELTEPHRAGHACAALQRVQRAAQLGHRLSRRADCAATRAVPRPPAERVPPLRPGRSAGPARPRRREWWRADLPVPAATVRRLHQRATPAAPGRGECHQDEHRNAQRPQAASPVATGAGEAHSSS